jgi:hypothetical protein
MKRVAILVFVVLVAWQVYGQYRAGAFASLVPALTAKPGAVGYTPTPADGFKCDLRTHCAQMTSCAEAKFFQKNCRDADLEVTSDGVPCARRWCVNPNSP